jgi:hypothetical protein
MTPMVGSNIKNAYKLNPWAFKPNPESFYRQIGNEGLTDALSSNTIRSANQSTFPRPHFVEGTDFTKLYSTGEGATGSRPSVIFETSGINQAGEPFVFPSNSTSGYTPWIAGDATVPLSEGRILQKDWLRGYQEVPVELPGSPNGFSVDNVGKGIKQSSNKIDQSIIDNYTKREIDWLNSEEAIKRNMTATGKSREAVIKENNEIIKQLNKTTLNVLDDKADMAAGVYSQNKKNPVINLFNTGNEEQLLNVADHEIKHAVSQQAIRSHDGLIDLVTNPYKKYPTVNVKKWYDNFIPGETTSKWASNAPEQQVVSKRIMDLVEKTQGVKRGTQLTDDNIKGVTDLLNKEIKNGNPQNSDIVAMLSSFKSKFGKNYYPIVKDMVNKAYLAPVAIGAAALYKKNNKNKKKII